MPRQESSGSHRGKRLLKPEHRLQVFLLVAVCIWLAYQLSHSYIMRRAVVVEIIPHPLLGRKGLVKFASDAAGAGEDAPGISGGGQIITGRSGAAVERRSVPNMGPEGEDEEYEGPSGYDDDDVGMVPKRNNSQHFQPMKQEFIFE